MNLTLDRNAETGMPKPSGQTSIKIDKDLIEMLAIIKNATGENMSDYLSRISRASIERDYRKAMALIAKRHPTDDKTTDED